MNNVHRLVVPMRDETRGTPAEATPRTADVLILPCIRYERMDARDSQMGRRAHSPVLTHEAVLQDLTA